MKLLPSSRKGRALLIIWVAALAAALTFNIANELRTRSDPADYYWYTMRDGGVGQEIDPTKCLMSRNVGKHWKCQQGYEELDRTFFTRCEPPSPPRPLRDGPPPPLNFLYMDVLLCNTAWLAGDDWARAKSTFQSHVNRSYRRNSFGMANAIALGVIEGVGAVAVVWLGFSLAGRVRRGTP